MNVYEPLAKRNSHKLYTLQVRWSLHTLFYLLCNNEASQQEAKLNPGFEARHAHTRCTVYKTTVLLIYRMVW